MGCGCGRRSRAAAEGKEIAGYRVVRPDGTTVPPVGRPPFMTPADARSEIRGSGGGSAYVVYKQTDANGNVSFIELTEPSPETVVA